MWRPILGNFWGTNWDGFIQIRMICSIYGEERLANLQESISKGTKNDLAGYFRSNKSSKAEKSG